MKPNVAFFDSGQGGLTIWENVVKHFPNINTVYLGDNARTPYGNKSPETIVQYTCQAGTFLEKQNAKLLVIVCGTASSVATKHLQNFLKIPVIGIVEGLSQFAGNLLMKEDSSLPVAVLATRYTIKSQSFQKQLALCGLRNVWARECPLFVPLIEEGISQGDIVDSACHMYLNDIPYNVKVVLLACTHYPRIVNAIAKYLTQKTDRSVVLKFLNFDLVLSRGSIDNPIFIIEASTPIIQRLTEFFSVPENDLQDHGTHRTFCTDSPTQFERVANYFTQLTLPKIELVEISNDK